VDVNPKTIPDRRRWLRHKVHTPAFASFDGVTGGMILDLSEQGMSMQTAAPIQDQRPIQLHLNLSEPAVNLETTGYIAWADALGRAGVRFSELPEESRLRLQQWLTLNDAAPSRKAPKFTLGEPAAPKPGANPRGSETRDSLALSLEPQAIISEKNSPAANSTTVQYEFNSLGSDLNASLRLISERARSLTRGTGAAIALAHHGSMMCRASVGSSAPALGSRLDINTGFSGECVRGGAALRCDDTETDSRVDIDRCRQLGIRSILAAPIQYQREIIGLLEVFSTGPFAFDEGDVAVVERLAQTVVLTMSHASALSSR
jgi:GAF domain-containing protein/PilZ domain-containing protein